MAEIFEQMQRMIITIAVGEAIGHDQLLSPPEFQGAYDPHIWFDVEMWIKVVKFISTKLVTLDSINAQTYESNTENYLKRLFELDEYLLKRSQEVLVNKRVLITAHDAFNYFGRAYGFEVKGLQGISTAAEAGTADVQKLAEFIVDREIPAIFVETSVPPRYIEALQAAVNSRGYKTKIGGNLFSDAMGNPGTMEGTYVGMVKHNIDTIVNSLIE
jgi:manganese/zinc/iron transport system substrate-binding protein